MIEDLEVDTEAMYTPGKTCLICSSRSRIFYSGKWDAFFCSTCNIWLEKSCGDPNCWFHCNDRPEKPIGRN